MKRFLLAPVILVALLLMSGENQCFAQHNVSSNGVASTPGPPVQTAAWTSVTAVNTAITLDTTAMAGVVITLRSTTTITAGAINFEMSDDAGTNFSYKGLACRTDTAICETSFTLSANLTQSWEMDVAGFNRVRIRLNPIIAGTGTVNLRLQGTGSLGEPSVVVYASPPSVPTYDGSFTALAPAATPTDVFTISGSASKTILVTKLVLTCTQTTAGIINVLIIKRSTADTAGTSTNATAVPHDSNNAAATATVTGYTANPTVGTAVGTARPYKLGCMAPGTATPNDILIEIFGQNSQAYVLRGTAEQLAVNLNSVTLAGGSLNFYVEWIEQ